ncbi:MAG: hypothetical protein LEGION0398_MBIBDBAK_00250 [Legionellaceae bacterium]
MGKISLKPPASIPNNHKNKNDNIDKKTFISESDKKKPVDFILSDKEKDKDKDYPWLKEYVREDIKKLFNIRMSEPDWLKLKYISDKTGESMQEIIMDCLIPIMNKKLKKIAEEESDF